MKVAVAGVCPHFPCRCRESLLRRFLLIVLTSSFSGWLSDLEMSRRPVKYFSSRLTSGCKAVRHKFLLSPCYFCRAGVTVAPRAMEEMCLSTLVHLTSVSVWRELCAQLCFDNMQTSLIIKEALNWLTCKHWTSLFWLDVIAASQSHLYKIDQSVFVHERLLVIAGHSGVIYVYVAVATYTSRDFLPLR